MLRPLIEEASGIATAMDSFWLSPEFCAKARQFATTTTAIPVVGATHAQPIDQLRACSGTCRARSSDVRAFGRDDEYCCNNFHALKITFATKQPAVPRNGRRPFGSGSLCQDTSNIQGLSEAGFAFGGSCLPKELRATAPLRGSRCRDTMLAGIMQSNREHLQLALDKLMATGKRRIGLIGLSFKGGTDDLRESPLVTLAEQLIGKGMQLAVYDPAVRLSQLLGANRRYIDAHLPHIGKLLRAEIGDVIKDAEVVVVGLSGPEIIKDLEQFCQPGQVVLICRIADAARFRPRCKGCAGEGSVTLSAYYR